MTNIDFASLNDQFTVDVDTDGVLGDIDPDENVLNSHPPAECRYYSEPEFNDMVHSLVDPCNCVNIASLFHVNIRSLPHNFNNFQQYLECLDYSFPIIGVTETWHSDSTIDL